MADLQFKQVTFKTDIHCNGCMKKMHKSLSKIKGVGYVEIEKNKNLVTVTGFNLGVREIEAHMMKKYRKKIQIVGVEHGRFFGPPEADIQGGDEGIWEVGNGSNHTVKERSHACIQPELFLFMVIVFLISLVLVSMFNKRTSNMKQQGNLEQTFILASCDYGNL